jgi:exopolysaccharide biosynthesis polyprenyl glycosylphosphotransferase
MLRRFNSKRIVGFFLFDWFGTLAMLVVAAYLRIEIGFLPDIFVSALESLQIPVVNWWEGLTPRDIIALPVLILVSVIWPSFFISFSVYDGRRNETLKAELLNVFMAIIASTLVLVGSLFLTYRGTSRVVVIIFLLLDLVLLMGVRVIWYAYRNIQTDQKHTYRRVVLIVGAGEVGQNAAIELLTSSRRELKIIGFLDDDFEKQDQKVTGLPILGNLDQAGEVIETYNVRDAIVALPLHAYERLVNISKTLQDHSVRVHVIPDLFDFIFPGTSFENFGGLPIIDLGDPSIHGYWQCVKRIFDTVIVVIGLILLFPFLLLIAILIKVESPGSVFYTQKRIGFKGKQFNMIKFRTMYENAENDLQELIELNPSLKYEWNEYQKLSNDPRITRLGRILRRLSLDELPQIINIIRGEMSLIGPRPFLPSQLEVYGKQHYKNYIRVRPGITGMWQVSGRNRTSFATRAQWDEFYIRNWSMWLDLKIMIKTIGVVIQRSGAY